MGQTHVDISIHGNSGSVVVSALADTAATFTKVPRVVFDELGLEAAYEAEIETGDGRTIHRQLALADVEIDGVRRPVLVAAGGNGERRPSIRPCTGWGLPCLRCCHRSGELLPRHFTLTPYNRGGITFCGTFRRVAPPRR